MANLAFTATVLGLRGAQALSPGLAGWWAERLFFTPPRRPLSGAEHEVLRGARAFTVTSEGRRVRAWQWGTGPVVLLVHGWGGAGGRFSTFVQPILAAGFSAVTYDGPGHGLTGRGRSSAPQLARALTAVVEQVGRPHAIVAHSLGGTVTAIALANGIEPSRAVLLAPVSDAVGFVDRFGRDLGLKPETLMSLRNRSERRIRFPWDQLDVIPVFSRARSPALVVHDRNDETVSIDEGKAIAAAWPGAELVVTEGLGHRGVLRDQSVVSRAVAFATTR